MRDSPVAATLLRNCETIPESVLPVVRLLANANKIQTVIVFGSRAVGDHDARSDVDIAISAPGMSRSELAIIRDRVDRAKTLYDVAVTPLEGMPVALRDRVLSLGVVVYERPQTPR